MNNPLLMKYVKPYLFSFFFTAAMTSLLWITMTYGSLNAVPIAAGLCALMYSGLALAALVNLFRGNKLFEGSSADVLSVSTQKGIRAAGVAVALPALIYCGIFALLLKTHDFSDVAEARVANFEKFEIPVLGSAKLRDAISAAYAIPVCTEPVSCSPTLAPQQDVNFGPFMADMQVQIKKAWFPEKSYNSKHAEVFFAVDKNGKVSKLRIDRSSGSEAMDKAALDAVERAAPFQALPNGAPDSVDIKFTFDYNVFNSDSAAQTSEATSSDDKTVLESVDYSAGDSFTSSAAN